MTIFTTNDNSYLFNEDGDGVPCKPRYLMMLVLLNFVAICVMYCRSFFVICLLAIVLHVLLGFTTSDYPFGIFKLSLRKQNGQSRMYGRSRYTENIGHTRYRTKTNKNNMFNIFLHGTPSPSSLNKYELSLVVNIVIFIIMVH
jgi:hypothetical protein